MPTQVPSGLRSLPNLVASWTSSRRSGDRPADQLLVGERAVHVGGVEEGHAEVEGPVDGVDARLLVGGAVELRHPHAAEAEGGDGEGADLSCLDAHASTLRLRARSKSTPRPGRGSGWARPCSRRARSCGRWRRRWPVTSASWRSHDLAVREQQAEALGLVAVAVAHQRGIAAYVADGHAGARAAGSPSGSSAGPRRCSDGGRTVPGRPSAAAGRHARSSAGCAR